jgi:DNA-binding transcriptional ArsR family regulator
MVCRTNRKEIADKALKLYDTGFFRALCEPVRVKILRLIVQRGPSDVAAIASAFEQDRSVISRHLGILKEAGILVSERRGRQVIYEVDGPAILKKLEALTEETRRIVPFCCPGLDG